MSDECSDCVGMISSREKVRIATVILTTVTRNEDRILESWRLLTLNAGCLLNLNSLHMLNMIR
jgi:hypothetical protein